MRCRAPSVELHRAVDLTCATQLIESNQATQLRSFSYDGYGRLSSRTTPEQGTTSYNYNLDDTTNFVTDARGAKTIFGYNPRHLVSSISYDLSNLVPGQSVAATSNVSFTYDPAGNRRTMSDGMGSVTYAFDNLSQLTSETRTFVVNSYALSYTYNLVGELASITNQWGTTVNYGYDKVGRVTGVNDPGGVLIYANALSYRAFWRHQENELRRRPNLCRHFTTAAYGRRSGMSQTRWATTIPITTPT